MSLSLSLPPGRAKFFLNDLNSLILMSLSLPLTSGTWRLLISCLYRCLLPREAVLARQGKPFYSYVSLSVSLVDEL